MSIFESIEKAKELLKSALDNKKNADKLMDEAFMQIPEEHSKYFSAIQKEINEAISKRDLKTLNDIPKRVSDYAAKFNSNG